MTQTWINVKDREPELLPDGECGWPESERVLVFTTFKNKLIAFRMQMDEDSPVRWKSACSEGWDLTGDIVYWMPLPPDPY